MNGPLKEVAYGLAQLPDPSNGTPCELKAVIHGQLNASDDVLAALAVAAFPNTREGLLVMAAMALEGALRSVGCGFCPWKPRLRVETKHMSSIDHSIVRPVQQVA